MSYLKAKEEVEALEKKMVQLENELAQTQTNLDTATHNLEEKEKALQNVCAEIDGCMTGMLLHLRRESDARSRGRSTHTAHCSSWHALSTKSG